MNREQMEQLVKELFGENFWLEYYNGTYRIIQDGFKRYIAPKKQMEAFLYGAQFMKDQSGEVQ